MAEKAFTQWRRVSTGKNVDSFVFNEHEAVVHESSHYQYYYWNLQNPNHIQEQIIPLLSYSPLHGRKMLIEENKLFITRRFQFSLRSYSVVLQSMNFGDGVTSSGLIPAKGFGDIKYINQTYFIIAIPQQRSQEKNECSTCHLILLTSTDFEEWTHQEIEHPMGTVITHDGESFYIFGLPEASALKSKDGQNWEKYSINQQINN